MKNEQNITLIDYTEVLETVEDKKAALKTEIERVKKERSRAKQLLQELGISAFLDGQASQITGKFGKSASKSNGHIETEKHSGWHTGIIDENPEDIDFGLKHTKNMVGQWYEELKVKHITREGQTQLGGVWVTLGRIHGEGENDWFASYILYEGDTMNDTSILMHKAFRFNPLDPNLRNAFSQNLLNPGELKNNLQRT